MVRLNATCRRKIQQGRDRVVVGKTITIEKEWDGNECVTEYNGREYVSRGRWQWILTVDGVIDSAHDRKRDAQHRADQIRTEGRS